MIVGLGEGVQSLKRPVPDANRSRCTELDIRRRPGGFRQSSCGAAAPSQLLIGQRSLATGVGPFGSDPAGGIAKFHAFSANGLSLPALAGRGQRAATP